MECLRLFATEFHGAPHRRKSAPPPRLDNALFKHLLGVIECFTADAAADEQLAGELLRAPADIPSVPDNYDHLTNLAVVARDRAHAARCSLHNKTFR
jgi:hypothetical protein